MAPPINKPRKRGWLVAVWMFFEVKLCSLQPEGVAVGAATIWRALLEKRGRDMSLPTGCSGLIPVGRGTQEVLILALGQNALHDRIFKEVLHVRMLGQNGQKLRCTVIKAIVEDFTHPLHQAVADILMGFEDAVQVIAGNG